MPKFLKTAIKRIDNKNATIADSGIYSDVTGFINTGSYLLNMLFSGSLYKGIPDNKIIMAAGPEGVGKSFMLLSIIGSFLKEYPKGNAIIFESESAIQSQTLIDFGIDTSRILFVPITTVQELRTQSLQILEEYEKLPLEVRSEERLFLGLDSLGNLSTTKELEDSLAGKETVDMTRAKLIKSVFRTLSIKLGILKVPFFCTNHIYMSQSLFPSAIASGGCLRPHTQIRMLHGPYKEVQEIKVGDWVQTKEGQAQVSKVWSPETLELGTPQCLRFHFNDGSFIDCSVDHKFLKKGQWVEAKSLVIGDKLDSITEPKEITFIFDLDKRPVYDIEVFPDSNYILHNGLYSHNSGTKYAASTIVFLSKRKEKEGTVHLGNVVHCKLDKSRFTREGSQVDIMIDFSKGLDPYWGLLDALVESNLVKSVGHRFEFPTGEKVFKKEIKKNPDLYFTKDLLIQLDGLLGKKFLYGCVLENQEEFTEDDDTEDLELE